MPPRVDSLDALLLSYGPAALDAFAAQNQDVVMPAGAPQLVNYPDGRFEFRMAAQAFRTPLHVAEDHLAEGLIRAAQATLPAGVRVTLTGFGMARGPDHDPEGLLRRSGPTWWVTIRGIIDAPVSWNLTGDSGLNHALAVALWQNSNALATEYPRGTVDALAEASGAWASFRPDGYRQLQNALDNPEACGSFFDDRRMWMRGCTTITRLGNATAAPSPTPTPAQHPATTQGRDVTPTERTPPVPPAPPQSSSGWSLARTAAVVVGGGVLVGGAIHLLTRTPTPPSGHPSSGR